MNSAIQVFRAPAQETDFRFEVNALRAFAVLAVMGYHFGIPGFTGGFAGVDIFFVISGFLISSQILASSERNAFSFSSFYISRLRRIFPALFAVVVACLVWGWFFYLPKDYINTNRHAASALFFVSNIAFDGERGYFDAAAHTKALLHTWSLAVEVQFYFFLPLFLIALRRFANRHLVFWVGVLLLITSGWALYTNQMTPGKGFYLLSCRAWEFLIGVMLATSKRRQLGTLRNNLLSVLGLALLVASFCLLDSSVPWPGVWTLLPATAATVIIFAGNTDTTRNFFASRPLQGVGNVSYSLYLWHWPVWVFGSNLTSIYGRTPSGLDRFGMIAFSFLLAYLSWRYIEQPIRTQRQWWTNKRVVSLFATSALVVFGFGLSNVAMNGMPFRLPAYVQHAADATFLNTPRDECFRRGDSTKDAPEQFCVFGASKKSDPELVLWGDSHANQYLTAVSDAASTNNLLGIIATQSACSARRVGVNAVAVSSCENFNREVYTYVTDHSSIKTVILGKWWSDLHNEFLLELVGDLVAIGKKVIVIGALPSPGFDVPERWSKQQISAGRALDSIDVPLISQSMAFSIRKNTLSQLEPYLKDGRVIYIDPLQKFCDEKVCHLVEDGFSNFRDDSHLSHSSSVRFVQEFDAAIQKMKSPHE